MARAYDLIQGFKEGFVEKVTFELRLEKWLQIKVKSLEKVLFMLREEEEQAWGGRENGILKGLK